MDLITELKRRMNDDSDIYSALGAEIKQHRIRQSKTLSSMCEKDFSISYLCKIEKNQVKPSRKYLKEICEKINISDAKVSCLLSSRDILLEVVKCFYFKDIKRQNEILFNFTGLDNHRIILIRFICALTRLDIVEARDYIPKIWDLTANLADLDLILFTTFYGVYKFYTGEYIEAIDYIRTALEFQINIPYLDAIEYGYLFISAYNTYSRSTIDYYLRLEHLTLKYGETLNLEYAHYYMSLYYLMFKQFSNFNDNIKKISNPDTVYSLETIRDIYMVKAINIDESRLNSLAKAYYYLYIESTKALEIINETSIQSTNKLLLQYKYYKNTDKLKAIDYIIDVILPHLVAHNISSVGYILLNDILTTSVKMSKYKRLCDMFQELYSISLDVDSL